MKTIHKLLGLLIMVTVSAEEDWMLHTPGGGPLESRCPCMAPEHCPRMFGESELDVRHFGQIPICMDSRQVRCCGASLRVELSSASELREEHPDALENKSTSKMANSKDTQRTEQEVTTLTKLTENFKQHHVINSSEATQISEVTDEKHQPRIAVDNSNTSKMVNMKNNSNMMSQKIINHTKTEQLKLIKSLEEHLEKSNFDKIIVLPSRMSGKTEFTEKDDLFIVYPSKHEQNGSDSLKSKMENESLFENKPQSKLFEVKDMTPERSLETPITNSDTEESYIEFLEMPEKDYFEASGSEHKGVRTPQDSEEELDDTNDDRDGIGDDRDGNDDDDVEIDEYGEDERDNDDAEDQDNVEEFEKPTNEPRALTDDVQNKRSNIPKRTFVSENLKMRISQLSARPQKPVPRSNSVVNDMRNVHTVTRPGQVPHSFRGVVAQTERRTTPRTETANSSVIYRSRATPTLTPKARHLNRNTRIETVKTTADISVNRNTSRPQPSQWLRTSTPRTSLRVTQDRTTSSRPQSINSRMLDANNTHRSTLDQTGTNLRNDHLESGYTEDFQSWEGDRTFPRHRQFHLKRNSEAISGSTVEEIRREAQQRSNGNLLTTGGNPTDTGLFSAVDTKSATLEGIHSSENKQNRAVDHSRHPSILRRKATETLNHNVQTFGARTRSRERSPFQSMLANFSTKQKSGPESETTHFSQSATEMNPLKSISHLTAGNVRTSFLRGDSVNDDIPVAEKRPSSFVGPIPKGFTDPTTVQNVDIIDQRKPLLHLPYSVQSQVFRTNIPTSIIPSTQTQTLLTTNSGVSSPGEISFDQDVNSLSQPHTQKFQQNYVFNYPQLNSPQKYVQTIIANSNSPHVATFRQNEEMKHQLKQISPEQHHITSSHAQSHNSNIPITRIPIHDSQIMSFHLPYPNYPEQFRRETPLLAPLSQPAGVIHSSPDNVAVRAEIVPITHTSSFQKFLSFPEQQLKNTGSQKEQPMPSTSTDLSLNSQGSKFKTQNQPETHSEQETTFSKEEQSEPFLFALYQRDAADRAAQYEYTKKLQDYFQELQNYYKQQIAQ